MSPYAEELAHARLEALRQLIDAMREAEYPAEKRRCAVAIFNAPEPTDLDDAIELEDDDTAQNASESQQAPNVNKSVESPSPSTSPIAPSSAASVPPPAFRSLPISDIRHRTSNIPP